MTLLHKDPICRVDLPSRWSRNTAYRIHVICVAFALLSVILPGCREAESTPVKRPRDQVLPALILSKLSLSNCSTSSGSSKPVDSQAKAWFDESLVLRERRSGANIDWERVRVLERNAAARHYWPAVRVVTRDVYGEQKILLIEQAMRDEEPEAFFMMGELYMKGDGVEINHAKAHAFWNRAAEMGDARAMVKLAVLLSTKHINTTGWDMVNIPVATSMLECAMKKGHGDAAVVLREIVSRPRKPDGSFADEPAEATEAHGLAVLQEGVKLGSHEAASELSFHFMMQHHFKAEAAAVKPRVFRSVDALRSRYYRFLQHSLDEATTVRLPNLDAAVPLPPTSLPYWRDADDNIVGLWETAASPAPAKAAPAPGLTK